MCNILLTLSHTHTRGHFCFQLTSYALYDEFDDIE